MCRAETCMVRTVLSTRIMNMSEKNCLAHLWTKRQWKTSEHFRKSLCDETSICNLSGVLAGETSARAPDGTQQFTVHNTILVFQEKQGPRQMVLWVCSTYLAHSQWGICSIHTQWGLGLTFGYPGEKTKGIYRLWSGLNPCDPHLRRDFRG